jgi:hypothetical protein
MENWKKAAEYAKMVMDDQRFKLVDLSAEPTEGTNDNGETVRTYITMPTYKCSETIWPYGNVTDMFKWTYDYANTENSITGQMMHAYFQASKELLDSYLEWDLRLTHYIVQAPDGNNGMMNMAFGKVNVGTKYYLPINQTGTFGRCLRLSEAYLNYAEAMAMLGGSGDTEAAATINKLREKRFFEEDFEEESFSSNAELVQFIRDERRRELCFEGHRWFDLRRWGMPTITHNWHTSDSESDTYRLEEGDLLYTIPIPDEALASNSSLVQNELPGSRAKQ